MIWNYSYNRPLGKIQGPKITPSAFEREVEEWLEESKDNGFFDCWKKNKYDYDTEQNIRASLECVKYDIHEFMLSHSYYMIKDAHLREYFIINHCLSNSLSPNNIDLDYYYPGVNILAKSDDMRWGTDNTVSDFDIYCRLYFCETDEDIWDIFADGIGDIESLYNYYEKQNSLDKAYKALLYVYNYEDKFLRAVVGRTFKTCPKSVKEEIESILINQYYDGMYDNFFDEKNIERVQEAWNTKILEIRKEFLQSEHSLKMLKRILNNMEFDSDFNDKK